jgi:hypothetical protein
MAYPSSSINLTVLVSPTSRASSHRRRSRRDGDGDDQWLGCDLLGWTD